MRTNLKERAGRLARYVTRLDEVHQRHFLATLFACFSAEELIKRFEWVSHLVYPESKWLNQQLDGKNLYAGHEEDPDGGGLHVQTLLRNQSKDDAVPYQDGAGTRRNLQARRPWRLKAGPPSARLVRLVLFGGSAACRLGGSEFLLRERLQRLKTAFKVVM